MACGFEKMAPGSLDTQAGNSDDRALSVDNHIQVDEKDLVWKMESYSGDVRHLRPFPRSHHGSDVRKCWKRTYGEIRNNQGTFCEDRMEESQTFHPQPVSSLSKVSVYKRKFQKLSVPEGIHP